MRLSAPDDLPNHQEERKLGLEPEPAVLCGTLEIVRHLVQRLGATLDTARVHAILSAVVGLVSAPSFRVRLSMTQLIGALATRGYLRSEVGTPLLLFLIRQAAVPAEDALEGRRRTGETVGALETRSVAAKTLELLARTVPPMRQVLWPCMHALTTTPLFPTGAADAPSALAHVARRADE